MPNARSQKPAERRAADSSFLVAVVILGCALRLTGLDVHSLWFDELATIQIASSPDLLRALELDRHPPLSFLAFRAWSEAFGSDAATLRLLPAVISCAALVLFCGVARSVLRPRARLAATALYAVAPFHVWFAQEVRMYAFLELFAATALWSTALRRPRARALLLFASGCLAVGTHYMGVLVIALVAGVGIARFGAGHAHLRRVALDTGAALAGVMLWIPWVVQVVPAQMESEWVYLARFAPSDLLEFPVRQILTGGRLIPESLTPAVYALSAVLLLGCAWNLVRAVRSPDEADRVPAAAWLFPMGAALAMTLFTPPNFLPRYLIVASPGVALATAGGLASIRWPGVRAAALLCALLGCLGITLLHRGQNHREDFRSACSEVRAQWRPGDAILSVTGTPGDTSRAAFDHYFRDDADLLDSCTTWEDVTRPTPRTPIAGRLHVVVRGAPYTRDRLAALRDRFELVDESPWRQGVQRLLLEPRP